MVALLQPDSRAPRTGPHVGQREHSRNPALLQPKAYSARPGERLVPKVSRSAEPPALISSRPGSVPTNLQVRCTSLNQTSNPPLRPLKYTHVPMTSMLLVVMLILDVCSFCYQNKNTHRVESEHSPPVQDKMHFRCINDS